MKAAKVVIVGAGIGGLCAALSLQRHGMKVAVFERTEELGEVGAGVVLAPNATHGLKFLGLEKGLRDIASNLGTNCVKHYRTGEIIEQRPHGSTYLPRYGSENVQVHRADLHDLLSRAVLSNDPDCIQTGSEFAGFSQDGSLVRATFRNGATAFGDALIGCDGIRSTVRAAAFGAQEVDYIGQVALRALAPMDRFPAHLVDPPKCNYVGPGRTFLHFPVRNDKLLNIVAIARQPVWHDEGWAIPATKEEFSVLYSDFHPSVREIIDGLDQRHLFKWGLRDREPAAVWTSGRLTLLGDAAHPMTPFLAQGAALAIEDGVVLGRAFEKAENVEDALILYENARKERANGIQLASREQMWLLQGTEAREFGPGISPENRGLFAYNPATAVL